MTLTMTPLSLLVTMITLLIGVITQAINTGKVLKWTVPASWMAWLTIVGPFLAGVSTSLGQAKDLSVGVMVNALLNGLIAVSGGAAPGVTVHLAMLAHYHVPRTVAMLRKAANDNAAPEAQQSKAA